MVDPNVESTIRNSDGAKLLAMLSEADDYLPEALAVARDEIEKRGGVETIKASLESEEVEAGANVHRDHAPRRLQQDSKLPASCPNCGKRFVFPARAAGETRQCSSCNTDVHVPTIEEREFSLHGESIACRIHTMRYERSDLPFVDGKHVLVVVPGKLTVFPGKVSITEGDALPPAGGSIDIQTIREFRVGICSPEQQASQKIEQDRRGFRAEGLNALWVCTACGAIVGKSFAGAAGGFIIGLIFAVLYGLRGVSLNPEKHQQSVVEKIGEAVLRLTVVYSEEQTSALDFPLGSETEIERLLTRAGASVIHEVET